MNRSILIARSVTGVLFLAQLVMGVVFWTGHALSLTQLHMMLGSAFVLALWTTTALAARAGAPIAPVITSFVLGLIVAVLGMTQRQLMPGPGHWVIRVLHLLLGFAAMAVVGRLVMSLRRAGHGPGPESQRSAAAAASRKPS